MLLAALPADLLVEVLSYLKIGEVAHAIRYLKQHTDRFARGRWKRRKVQNGELASLHKFLNATFKYDTGCLPRLLNTVSRRSTTICFTCTKKRTTEGYCTGCFVFYHRARVITPYAACRKMGRTSFPVPKTTRDSLIVISYVPAFRFQREYERAGWPVLQVDKWSTYLWLTGAEETAAKFMHRFNRELYITDF